MTASTPSARMRPRIGDGTSTPVFYNCPSMAGPPWAAWVPVGRNQCRGGPVRAPRSPDSGRLRGKPALRPSSAAGRGGRAVGFACVIALNPAGAQRLRACLRTDAETLADSRRSREASRTRPPRRHDSADGHRGMPAGASMRPPSREASAVRRSLGGGGAVPTVECTNQEPQARTCPEALWAMPTGSREFDRPRRVVRHCRARASAGAHDDRRPRRPRRGGEPPDDTLRGCL